MMRGSFSAASSGVGVGSAGLGVGVGVGADGPQPTRTMLITIIKVMTKGTTVLIFADMFLLLVISLSNREQKSLDQASLFSE
jgi:hypothetical protein